MSGVAWFGGNVGRCGNIAVTLQTPVAEDTTPTFFATIVDQNGNPVPGNVLDTLTLSIVDKATGTIVNGCQQLSILNTGRGMVDNAGNLTIALETGDTSLSEVPGLPSVERSLIVDWSYDDGDGVGRFQINFAVVSLAGP